jgi:hypothetical protein
MILAQERIGRSPVRHLERLHLFQIETLDLSGRHLKRWSTLFEYSVVFGYKAFVTVSGARVVEMGNGIWEPNQTHKHVVLGVLSLQSD